MLSKADNDLLTQTGPGTPMGKLFRRFWLPALLPSELPAPDCPPIRFRILSEDLVAFRDSDGRVGFFRESCPHRGASVFFGRNEEGGLRCVYHGWKFDVSGVCVDMPSEPAESNFKSKVRIGAYAAAEYAGLVWIYMGPPEKQPPLPKYQWTLQPEAENSRVTKHMQDSNYAQAPEGNIDSAHVSFLHRTFGRLNLQNTDLNVGPLIQTKETDFGFVYGGRRTTPDDQYYWRITAYVWPTFTQIAGTSRNGNGIFVIPMDDEHLWWFNVSTQHLVVREALAKHGQASVRPRAEPVQCDHHAENQPSHSLPPVFERTLMSSFVRPRDAEKGNLDLHAVKVRIQRLRRLLRRRSSVDRAALAPTIVGCGSK
jgi:phthalate 4,5-dioxygenase